MDIQNLDAGKCNEPYFYVQLQAICFRWLIFIVPRHR